MGGIINEAPFKETFNDPDPNLLGLIVGIYELGAFAGAAICAIVGEALGRRKSIFIGALVMLGGAAFQAAVSSSQAMLGARMLSGLGMVRRHRCIPRSVTHCLV